MQKLKEMWQNLSQKSKKLLAIIASSTLLVIVVAIFLIARGHKTEYQTLFTSLSQSEAQQVVSLLQEKNLPYLYEGARAVRGYVKSTTIVEGLSQVGLYL